MSVCTAETQDMFITYLIKLCALHLQKCFALLSRPWYTFKHGHMSATQCSMSLTDLMSTWHALPCYATHVCAGIDEKATVDNCPHWIADTSDEKNAALGALLLPCQQKDKTDTPSPKQPFSFLGQLAINSAKQLFSSVPAGVWLCCLWQCMADSTQWGMGLQGHLCVSVFIAVKEVTKISL